MIVYREQHRQVRVADAMARIAAAIDPVDSLIETGELAAAVADALSPEFDTDLPPLECLPRLPETVSISVPEGFAYYALYPETYRIAARQFVREQRPAEVVVIGIRSIGTALATVVADEFRALGCEVHSWTLRPRGHPFSRCLSIAPDLEGRWRNLANAHFAVVDEGPGLSGSSFASVADYLSSLGIPDSRIVLFPAWQPDPASFVSREAEARWRRHRKYTAAFEDLHLFDGARDLSGGRWRELLYNDERDWPAAHPQHERRKYLRDGVLWKFAGLGRYGRETLARACALESAGFGPKVAGLENGFLGACWTPAPPLAPGDSSSAETVARYLAFLAREFPCEKPADLVPMIRCNVAEGLGPEWAECLRDLRQPEAPACAIDNRMFPHEWLRHGDRYIKTDATDHHDDHFYPGPQDIAWDIAGFEIESGCPIAARYAALSGDATIDRRLPFHRLGWLAFRLGYATLAATALKESPDGARFRAQRDRYAAILKQEIAARA